MQLLGQLDPVVVVMLAALLGVAFGLSLSHQLKLQRIAHFSPAAREARLLQRITYAGLSMSLVFLIVIIGKHVSGVSYVTFIFVAAGAAIGILILKKAKGKKSRTDTDKN